jgi:hypothetical protein
MKKMSFVALCVALPVLGATTAGAQPAPPGNQWQFGTTVSLFGGVATPASTAQQLAGASIGWEMRPRIALEGTGTWIDGRNEADGFSAALTIRGAILPSRRASPFVDAGIGLYHASFEGGRELPDFYDRRRTGSALVATSFTDPSFVLGGGLRLFVSRHFALQPRVETTVIRADGDSHAITSFTIGLAYHFEDHPVTPARLPSR